MWREDSVKMMNSYYEMCRHLINKKDYEGLEIFFNFPIRFTEDGDVYSGFDDDMRNMINKILSIGDIKTKKFFLINGLNNKMCFGSSDLLYICLDNKEYFTLMIMAICKYNKNATYFKHLTRIESNVNAEIEDIHLNLNLDPEKWLKPKETSIKNNKMTLEINDNKQTKHVSWDDLEDSTVSLNIFNKLKKTVDANVKQYDEQYSMPLPTTEFKNEEINRPNILHTNEPIIPQSEIVKQLNEMNKKIDKLYEIVSKLSSLS